MDDASRQRVLDALSGRLDDDVRERFRQALGQKLERFESAIVIAYEDWAAFEQAFARDQATATVVGFLFNVVARLTMSVNLLSLGHLTLSGAAFRQAQEALATAFVMADYESPYRDQLWAGKFGVDKAVRMFLRQASRDPTLSSDALEVLSRSRAFYSKFSHPTLLAMADTIGLGSGGHHLGASFDPAKVPFYTKELESRTGFAEMLPNAMDGVAVRMERWPQFKRTG